MKSYNHEHYTHEFNEEARRSYASDMEGSDRDKGLKMYSKPYLWDEAKPASQMDIPVENFVPTPTIDSNAGFASFSLAKKIAVVGAVVVFAALILFCGISYFTHYFVR